MKKITEKSIAHVGAHCLCTLGLVILVSGIIAKRVDTALIGAALWAVGKAS